MKNNLKAFTLAEVLITLGIIGIVAVMTIPTLVTKCREQIIVNQLHKTHAVLNQAFKLAVADYDGIEGWDIGPNSDTTAGAVKLYNMFRPYLKLGEDCGSQSGCFYSGTYKSLFGNTISWHPRTWSRYARGRLLDGTSLAFWSNGSCKESRTIIICGTVYVDINGNQRPNQSGVDYFEFIITPSGIIPATPSIDDEICQFRNTSNLNGASCTGWVLQNKNLDYLRRDISHESPK